MVAPLYAMHRCTALFSIGLKDPLYREIEHL